MFESQVWTKMCFGKILSVRVHCIKLPLTILISVLKSIYVRYGITDYGVSRPGIQNWKDFCMKINIPKGNYWILRIGLMGSLSSLQKSELLNLIISFFHNFWCQNWDQWHKMSGKNTHIYFFYFWFKNKRVWAEKIGKKRKNSKNLKVAGNYPNI